MKRSNGHVADAWISITAVNPAPYLVEQAGEMLIGKAVDDALRRRSEILRRVRPSLLITSALTPKYRREMIRVFTKRAVPAAANN